MKTNYSAMATEKRRPGRPPRNVKGKPRLLALTATDEEWQRLLDALPQDTRDRYKQLAKMVEQENKQS